MLNNESANVTSSEFKFVTYPFIDCFDTIQTQS